MKNEKKQTQLSFSDKVNIAMSLPKEGGFKTITIIKEIQDKMKITQEDIKRFDVQDLGNGAISWNEKGNSEKKGYDLSDLEINEIKLCLEKLSKDGKLKVMMISLCETFGIKE